MLKSYVHLCTSFLNTFLSDHCYKNQIILPEQAAEKRDVWGCTEQLLMNKVIPFVLRTILVSYRICLSLQLY